MVSGQCREGIILFLFSRIRTLVDMATYSCHWIIMGKYSCHWIIMGKWKLAFIAISLQIFWQTFYRNVPWVVLYQNYHFCPNLNVMTWPIAKCYFTFGLIAFVYNIKCYQRQWCIFVIGAVTIEPTNEERTECRGVINACASGHRQERYTYNSKQLLPMMSCSFTVGVVTFGYSNSCDQRQ